MTLYPHIGADTSALCVWYNCSCTYYLSISSSLMEVVASFLMTCRSRESFFDSINWHLLLSYICVEFCECDAARIFKVFASTLKCLSIGTPKAINFPFV